MEPYWIAGGALVAFVACFPRASERTVLRDYPTSARLRVYLPFSSWRDAIAPSDLAVLGPFHRRAQFALPSLLVLALALIAWALASDHNLAESALDATHSDSVVSIQDAGDAAAVQEEASPVDRVEPEAIEDLRSPTRLYGTAKVKPIYRAHDVEGALITNIQTGSFWDMLGVRNGDVVIELHGEPVDSPTALVALMNVLERDEHVALRVRGTDGEVRYLEFRVPHRTAR